jgi:hypothetical protein
MNDELKRLVEEAVEVTGAAGPGVMEADAPVLTDEAIGGDGFYIVGLIGGKDVGKSALVNALVGREITARTSHGAGTAGVIAYAHVSQVDALKSIPDRHARD